MMKLPERFSSSFDIFLHNCINFDIETYFCSLKSILTKKEEKKEKNIKNELPNFFDIINFIHIIDDRLPTLIFLIYIYSF